LYAALLLTGPAGTASGTTDPVLPDCLVTFIDDIQLSAQEGGQLNSIEFREGKYVEQDAVIAQIDDQQAQHRKEAAEAEYNVAKLQAESDVNVRFSQASIDVAKSIYEMALEANKKSARAIAKADVQRRYFEFVRAELQKEQAERDFDKDKRTADGKLAELHLAETLLLRHQVRAPINGMILEVFREPGEWVNPGDAVVRLVRIDRLRIEGQVKVTDYNRSEIAHRPVTVEVKLASGGQIQTEKFNGKITFANPQIQGTDEYRVWAEVANRQVDGEWLLQPGLNAVMTIHLGPGGTAQQAQDRAGPPDETTPRTTARPRR